MTAPKRLLFISILSGMFGLAKAQELSCDKLNQLIKVTAGDSTLVALCGPERKRGLPDKTKRYQAIVNLWADENKDPDQSRREVVKYDAFNNHYYYLSSIINHSDEKSGPKPTAVIENMFRSCLGNKWILKIDKDEEGNPVYHFKNPENYVVIEIETVSGTTEILCFNDSRNSAPKCISGDCDNYIGVKQYFNDDIYSGTFIDGQYNGMGDLQRYGSDTRYEGGFINGQFTGEGSILNEKNEVVLSGIFFKGRMVNVDTARKTCQSGDCQNGFGLRVVNGGFYIGEFKDKLYDGLGELRLSNAAFFGHFKKNEMSGRGILIDSRNDYTFANFINGQPKGNYETDFVDKTSKEADTDSGAGNLYDENNILTQSGTWAQTGLIEKNDTVYRDIKDCAKSITSFYSHQKNDYREIRGEKLGFVSNKSTLLFLNTFEAKITVSRKYDLKYYIVVDLSGKITVSAKWIHLYNKFYTELNNVFGRRWMKVSDQGKVNDTNQKSSIVFQSIFDKSRIINLSINEKGVEMEIH